MKIFTRLKSILSCPTWILWIHILVGGLIGAQHYANKGYNNYKIFRQAFWHLLQRTDLHQEYPHEYFDIFLYAPPFAVLFSPFSFLSEQVGIVLWVAFTAWGFYYAVWRLPISLANRVFVWWFVFVELSTSLHNLQTNSWLVAFTLLAFAALERSQERVAGLFPSLGFFIKGYGGVGFALYPFYPKQLLRGALWALVWFVVLGVLPAFLLGFGELERLYRQWFDCLASDHKVNFGVSLIGMIYGIFNPPFPTIYVQLAGVGCMLAFGAYLLFVKSNGFSIRLAWLSYLLLWVILFNHAAGSSTHIVSVTGVALWYLISPQKALDKALLVFVFGLTCLSPTDIFPRFVREQYVQPYALKALPIFLVWLKLQYDIFTNTYQTQIRI